MPVSEDRNQKAEKRKQELRVGSWVCGLWFMVELGLGTGDWELVICFSSFIFLLLMTNDK